MPVNSFLFSYRLVRKKVVDDTHDEHFRQQKEHWPGARHSLMLQVNTLICQRIPILEFAELWALIAH